MAHHRAVHEGRLVIEGRIAAAIAEARAHVGPDASVEELLRAALGYPAVSSGTT